MSYPLDSEAPSDPLQFRIWVHTICLREEWVGDFPSKTQIKKNLQAYVEWITKHHEDDTKEHTALNMTYLAYKRQPTIGVPFEDFLKWARRKELPIGDNNNVLMYTLQRHCIVLEQQQKASNSLSSPNVSNENGNSHKRVCRRSSAESTESTDKENMDLAPQQDETSTEQVTPVEDNIKDDNPDDKRPVIEDNAVRPKPIIASGIEPDSLRHFIQTCEEINDINFTVRMLPGNYVKIFPETAWDKFQLCQHLEAKGVGFYVVPDTPKVLKVVIGRLDIDPDEIKDCLTRNGYQVQHITKMTSRRDGKPLPLYLVTLIKDDKAADIFNLESILRIRVRVTLYRPPKKATQCYRCNNFHHIAKHCKMPPRCSICSETHESKDCSRKKDPVEERTPPKCCNCGLNHVASYKGCVKYPNRLSYAQVTKNTTKANSHSQRSDKVPLPRPKKTPQLIKNAPNPSPIFHSDELRSDAQKLFEMIQLLRTELEVNSLSDLLTVLQDSIEAVKKETTLTSKRLVFLDAFMKTSSISTEQTTTNSG